MYNTDFTETMKTQIKARQTLINVISDDFDQERLERHLEAIAKILGRNLLIWNMVDGMQLVFSPDGEGLSEEKTELLEGITDVDDILGFIDASVTPQKDENGNITQPKPSLFYLQDFGLFLNGDHANPLVVRKAFVLGRKMKKNQSIFITSSADTIDGFINVDLALPGVDELKSLIENFINALPIDKSGLTENGILKIAQMLVGLSENEAKAILSYTIVTHVGLSDEHVSEIGIAKAEKLGENEALELVQSNIDFDSVGGLGNLKTWVARRKRGFTQEAKDFGISPPKGVVLLGIPGTGKSLAAKAIANEMNLPLVSFDIGAVFGSLVGQSEAQLRTVLKTLETLTPSVLWIDEIDKALSQSGDGDSGTSKRVLGRILTWIQETEGIFIVATGNNPQTIPVELLRKGRFDEVFFLDLPDLDSRKDIFKVHLEKVGRKVEDFDLGKLAQVSKFYTGAEIEASVKEALYMAFDKGSELNNQFIEKAISEIAPQSQTHKGSISMLRDWAKTGQCRLADDGLGSEVETSQTKVKAAKVETSSEFELDL